MGLFLTAVAGIVAKGIGAISANQAKQKAKGKANAANNQLKELEANRQKIVNPYEGYENLSGLATDISGMAKNAYAQLGVATQAAEFQAEEADLALANTLDTLRSTGAGAGGATALAQAALQSKKGVSASLEMQEAQNQKLRAQGEQRVSDIKMNEQLRLQGIDMSQAERMQQAEAMGKDYTYQEQEARELTQLERAQAKVDGAQANLQAAKVAANGSIGDLASSVVGTVGAGFKAVADTKGTGKDWWKQ